MRARSLRSIILLVYGVDSWWQAERRTSVADASVKESNGKVVDALGEEAWRLQFIDGELGCKRWDHAMKRGRQVLCELCLGNCQEGKWSLD